MGSLPVGELAACQDAITATHPGYLGANPEDLVLRLGPPRFAVYGGDSGTWAPWYVQHKIVRSATRTTRATAAPSPRQQHTPHGVSLRKVPAE